VSNELDQPEAQWGEKSDLEVAIRDLNQWSQSVAVRPKMRMAEEDPVPAEYVERRIPSMGEQNEIVNLDLVELCGASARHPNRQAKCGSAHGGTSLQGA
jgi:hypothetical protein